MERKRDAEGNVIGRANDNPIRDTRQYVVKFDSGEVTELTANVIAESMYSMCDKDGYQVLPFEAIVDHKGLISFGHSRLIPFVVSNSIK